MTEVLALAGAGDMATAVAVRLAASHAVVVGDPRADNRAATIEAVRAAGGTATAVPLDVTDPEQLAAFRTACTGTGDVTALLVAAGLGPVQATPARIVEVDLLGVMRVVDAFADVVTPGGAALVISSIAGHYLGPVPADVEGAWAHLALEELRTHPDLAPEALAGNPSLAYMRAKRAVQLRVRASAGPWGARGVRINTISPGVIDTAMGREELASPNGAGMRMLLDAAPLPRVGTVEEVASAAAFLLGPEAAYITGTDLIVDGGSVATALLPPAPATWRAEELS